MEEMPGPAEKEAVQPQKKSLEILAYQERLRAAVQKFLQPVRAFLVRRLGERRAARVLNLLAIPVQYFYDMKFSGYEKTGFSLVRQFWRAGWLGRVGLLAVLAGTLLTAAALASCAFKASTSQEVTSGGSARKASRTSPRCEGEG